jgi:hypothetical protein
MERRPPRRYGELEAARRAATRRLLAEGAIAGFVVGLIAQAFVSDSYSGAYEWLVRVALMLPAVVFLAWWQLSPGLRRELAGEPPATGDLGDPAVDVADRERRIEHVFDSAAVPRARRDRPELVEDAPARSEFRRSIRRDSAGSADVDAFGVPRPRREVDVEAR